MTIEHDGSAYENGEGGEATTGQYDLLRPSRNGHLVGLGTATKSTRALVMAGDNAAGASTPICNVFVRTTMSRTIKVVAVLAVAVLAYKFLVDASSSPVEYEP